MIRPLYVAMDFKKLLLVFQTAGGACGGAAHRRESLKSMFNMNRSDPARRDLPVYDIRKQLIEKIEAYPVTVVSGATGCGKSTQIPQFILDHGANQDKYTNIIVTQPRRLAAQAVAKRVCREREWNIGSLVGYKVGLDKSNSTRDTRLMYVTTGVLIKMLISKKSMAEWTHVIIDEVHERDKDMDFLLILARKFLTTNSQGVKIILMSATIKPDKLCRYFSWPMYSGGPVVDQAIYYPIPGTTNYDVTVFYLDELASRDQIIKGPEEKPALNKDCIMQCKRVIGMLSKNDKKYIIHIMLRDLLTQKCLHKNTVTGLDIPDHVE
jgi:HrpA-like RNA helicase